MAVAGSLHQASPTISARRLQAAFDHGRPCRRPCSPLQASAISGRDDRVTSLRRESDRQSSSSSSSPRPSLFKSVQEGLAPHAVIQQVSSLSHFFLPDLPSALVKEIKKRIPLISFRESDDDGEQAEMVHGLSSSLLADELEAQTTGVGPRCAWPRVKLASVRAARSQPNEHSIAKGPRCAWPRGLPSLQNLAFRQEEDALQQRKPETADGAKCTWPRVAGRTQVTQEIDSSISRINQNVHRGTNNVNVKIGDETDGMSRGTETMKGIPKCLDSGNNLSSSQLIEGPRCAWPRTTPRRMLATGVGLGLMNYLFVSQGAPALAILVQSPLPFTCEDDESVIGHKSLLP